MKHLVIIGSGGMGREVYHLAKDCEGYETQYDIKGFLDDNPKALDGFEYPYPPILASIKDYQVENDDVFACSVGDVPTKVKLVEFIESQGGKFISLVHPNVQINCTAKIGEGVLVFHDVHVGCEAIIGNHVMLQSYAAIGHDAVIGDFCRIDPKASVIGGVHVGNRVTLHTMSLLNHKVTVGDDATVGAMSFVVRKVKPGTTVFGIPAKEL